MGKASIIGRAVVTLGAIVGLAGGVTYAALTSNTVTLSASTISTGTASLAIYNTADSQFEKSAPGFTITNLVPGTGVDENVYLQNNGTTALDISANVPAEPAAPANGYGFSGFENVTVDITGGCGDTVNTNLLALNAGQVALPCNALAAGAQGNSTVAGTPGNYKFHFDIKPSAVTGSSAGVGPFDINFTGTPDNNNATVTGNPTSNPAGPGLPDQPATD